MSFTLQQLPIAWAPDTRFKETQWIITPTGALARSLSTHTTGTAFDPSLYTISQAQGVGPQGAQGAQGAAGPQGANGSIGVQGAQGAVGPQGANGAVGPQGAAGPQGAVGPQGANGAAGPQGANGANGAAGPQGAQGAAGPQGPKGDPGTNATRILSRLHVVGHSLSAGGGSSTMDRAWHNLIGGLHRSEVVNYGHGGAVLTWAESGVVPYGQVGDGGYARAVSSPPPAKNRDYKGAYAAGTTYKAGDIAWTGASLDALSWWRSQVDGNVGHDPTTDGGANWLPLTGIQSRLWSPAGRLPVIEYGLNDLGWDGNETAFLAALRYVMSYFQAAEVTSRADDPRCSFTAGWTARSAASPSNAWSGNVNGGIRGLPANTTDYEDIVIPPDFAGGHVTLGYLGTQPTATTGVISVFVDGSATAAVNYNLANTMTRSANKVGCFAIRVPLAAGAHHLRVRVTTVWDSGAIYCDYLAIEANPVPPVVVAGGLFYPIASYASVYGGGNHATDALVDQWNADIQALCANEFTNAHFLDVSNTIGKDRDPAKFSSDGLHPNDRVHAILADALNDLVEQVVVPAQTNEMIARLARNLRVGHGVRLDFGADYASGSWNAPLTWADFTYATSGAGTPSRTVEISTHAEAGDLIEVSLQGFWSNTATAAGMIDIYTVGWPNGTSQASAPINYLSSGGPVQAGNGLPSGALNAGVYAPLLPGPVFYKVRPEDLIGGEVTFRVQAKGVTAARGINLSSANPVILSARNTGQSQPLNGLRQAT